MRYVDTRGGHQGPLAPWEPSVRFAVADDAARHAVDCIILPQFENGVGSDVPTVASVMSEARRAILGQLAIQGLVVLDLAVVDAAASSVGTRAELARALGCDFVLDGTLTELRVDNAGFYSRVAIGVALVLTDVRHGTPLWRADHTAQSHGGGLPISPVSLGMALLEASNNLSDAQRLRVCDELARRLIKTLPAFSGDRSGAGTPDAETSPAEERVQRLDQRVRTVSGEATAYLSIFTIEAERGRHEAAATALLAAGLVFVRDGRSAPASRVLDLLNQGSQAPYRAARDTLERAIQRHSKQENGHASL